MSAARVEEIIRILAESAKLYTPESRALINEGADELRRAIGEKRVNQFGPLTEWSRLTERQRDFWRSKFMRELWEFVEKGTE